MGICLGSYECCKGNIYYSKDFCFKTEINVTAILLNFQVGPHILLRRDFLGSLPSIFPIHSSFWISDNWSDLSPHYNGRNNQIFLDSHAVKRHLYLELCSEEWFLLFCCWQLLLSLMLYSLHLASNGWTRWMDIWKKLRNVCFAFHGLFSCHLSNQKELIKNIVIN